MSDDHLAHICELYFFLSLLVLGVICWRVFVPSGGFRFLLPVVRVPFWGISEQVSMTVYLSGQKA